MRKIGLMVFGLLLLANIAFAGQTETEIIDTTLSTTTTGAEADVYIGDADRVTFFITYDSAWDTAAVTAVVTVAISLDGTNWQDISWFDVAGGPTPQTSETLTLDGTYTGWLFRGVTAPRLRIRVSLPNYAVYGPEDTAGVTVTVVQKK